jgi:formylglycine-generating enzyme required for sulfatase activity
VSAWRLEEVRQLAKQQGVRFAFAPPLRSSLLRWLLQAEGIGKGSLYARALGLWRSVLSATEHERAQHDATQPWHDTPAQRRLQLDRALLDLWDDPQQAAIELHRLSGAGLAEEIRRLLGEYGPRGAAPPLIALPWRWQGLSAQARLLLSRLGLGGLTEDHVGLRRPARYPLAVAALGTAALAAVFHAAKPAKELGPPQVTQEAPPPAEPKWRTEAIGDRYRVIAELGESKGQVDVPPSSRVVIRWNEEKQQQKTDIADWCPYKEETHQGIVYVRVCAGEFTMGSAEEDQEASGSEKPAHRVKLDEFWIGKYELSNAEYRKRVPDHKSLHDRDDQPVNTVSWHQAKAFCEAQGGRLPTEAEWEYAARGRDGRKYPWGDGAPERKLAVFEIEDAKDNPQEPEAVTSHPDGKGPFGTLNQAGNVWEWVADCFAKYPKSEAVLVNPRVETADCKERVLRGGSFVVGPGNLRSANRVRFEPGYLNWYIGFRCVRSVSRQP